MNQEKAFRRASFLQLVLVALVQVAVNLYVSFTGYISYYLTGIVGFSVILAGSFVTIFRIWDAVTDVGMGTIVDKTNSRFGKFRPYMIAGGIATPIIAQIMIRVTPLVAEGTPRKAFFIIIYMLFVIATTMQACASRACAQMLTDDPKQRVTYGTIVGILVASLYSIVPIIVFSRIVPVTRGFNQQFFNTLLNIVTVVALISVLLSAATLSKFDVYNPNAKKSTEKVTLKGSLELLTKNRPFLMLVLSAGTDKLATTVQGNATVVVIMYAIVCGNSKLSSATNSYTLIPSILMILLGLGAVGRKYGARRALLLSSIGGIVINALSIALWIFGDPKTMSFPGYEGFNGWTFFTMAYLVLWCLMKGLSMIGTHSLNPLIADVIDYETYRSGQYRPGTIGSLFNLADKVISSLGPTVIAILCAMIGFAHELPTIDTPYSNSLFAIGLLGLYGISLIGLIVNVICLKFYDLTPEKMAQIREELAKREAANA